MPHRDEPERLVRGGAAEFKWSDVAASEHRENYLGHSVNAPAGRWQKNKDVHWYNRDKATTQAERDEEIRQVKQAEEDALAAALGFRPITSSANAIPVTAPKASAETGESEEERKARKEARRAEKEQRRADKEDRRANRRATDRRRYDSRSPPRRYDDDRRRDDRSSRRRSRSRSPERSRRRTRSPRERY
ncbi:uncharacterized protein L969DRAFT_86794 [Mixia osmundae IAM 14324]|uniref:Multiple myeloma tumor-associated protein 2-like N-terminal domain-containing protein n=1 Tax=Mixia osmundae (strain CBS 9802 / IAM 14324 / JCM 22182 / KY 12970) TaxID=764103 RepID=G7E8R3_MIXOS|nr:uncharacterized protein L969DRAFT_86794 [Mixia osmundae IAM 14324]KEI40167.1 hypothetical protein L969DRAFT_86794 [Mixia osmundae IAM 14324]GAA99531.1 hypothetical protein E5Q_06232 [Mixia osmundae IAM 14324]